MAGKSVEFLYHWRCALFLSLEKVDTVIQNCIEIVTGIKRLKRESYIISNVQKKPQKSCCRHFPFTYSQDIGLRYITVSTDPITIMWSLQNETNKWYNLFLLTEMRLIWNIVLVFFVFLVDLIGTKCRMTS